ncbi:phage Gp37/Gp68 family protein [Burkholderia cenocepacia]|uniref:phage Gp37/Gp68 family protein n=1 Tax=Burkholderia cenocepacia TaxID=95486 RepID=UPI002238D25E|nr:phage Gp37/Gp68 family protein [Burkholderia cenocepacia]MCW5141097.1 phage Gp37/Gp68 family protein [Burkholderia cenocepacia]
MSENSKIEWTDATFNPWEGCQKVGPGCDHCYAETRNARFSGGTATNWGPGAPRRRTSAANWRKPLAWNARAFFQCNDCGRRGFGMPYLDVNPGTGGVLGDGHECEACGSRDMEPVDMRVFCASLADVFDNAVDPAWRRDLFELIARTPNLEWLLLTKRIGNARDMLNDVVDELSHGINTWDELPWPNVRLGATITNQPEADRDISKLLAVPARGHFLSMEPLLGPVTIPDVFLKPLLVDGRACFYPDGAGMVDWVIVGGESGPCARPMHSDWARSLRDQCAAASVPFLFKQWGEWAPAPEVIAASGSLFHRFSDGAWMQRVGKRAAGRLLDGRTHDEYPAHAPCDPENH